MEIHMDLISQKQFTYQATNCITYMTLENPYPFRPAIIAAMTKDKITTQLESTQIKPNLYARVSLLRRWSHRTFKFPIPLMMGDNSTPP